MEDLDKKRRERKQGLIFGTILILIFLLLMWIFGGEENKTKTMTYSIIFIFGIIGAWLFYFYQTKQDKRPQMQKTVTGKIIKGLHIYGGINLRIGSIFFIILAIVFLVVGIYELIDGFVSGNKYWWLGIIVIALGVLFILLARNLWKISRPHMKGRYY